MQFEFLGKISIEGFPLVYLEIRRFGATSTDSGFPSWAIVDTASANSYIRPNVIGKVPGLQNAIAPGIPFATGLGGDEAPGRFASLWAKGHGQTAPVELIKRFHVGLYKTLVQPVLIGKDVLQRGTLHINWTNKEVRLTFNS